MRPPPTMTPNEIRARRQGLGLTRAQFCEMVKISMRTYDHWEVEPDKSHFRPAPSYLEPLFEYAEMMIAANEGRLRVIPRGMEELAL